MKREKLLKEIKTSRTTICRTTSSHLRQIFEWPPYPKHYEYFNMTDPGAVSPDGRYWWEKLDQPNRLHYSVVLPRTDEVIGLYVFTRIDWEKNFIGNMGIRFRADCCNQNYGQETFKPLLQALLRSGIQRIRLDVAATNARAVRCYEKSGMKIVEEFFNNHEGPEIDLDDPHWKGVKQHFISENNKLRVRFYYMEILNE